MLKFYVYGTLRDNKAMSKAHEGAAYIEEKLPGVKITTPQECAIPIPQRTREGRFAQSSGGTYNPSMACGGISKLYSPASLFLARRVRQLRRLPMAFKFPRWARIPQSRCRLRGQLPAGSAWKQRG